LVDEFSVLFELFELFELCTTFVGRASFMRQSTKSVFWFEIFGYIQEEESFTMP
jgi:hypothetical protein